MINEHLRAKIKKLLDMVNMGTGNEAEVAMEKIRMLMQSYGITQDDINLYMVNIPAPKKKERWLKMLVELCAEFSGAASLFTRKMFVFAGDEIGVNVACELLTYLKNEIERQLKKRIIKGRKLKNDFRLGCIVSLHEKMESCGGWRDMEEKRKSVIKTHFSKVKPARCRKVYVDGTLFETGKESAVDININRQAGVSANAGYIGGLA